MSQTLPRLTGPEADAPPTGAADVFANRIAVLYRLSGHHLELPFSALCLAAVFYTHVVPMWLAVIPFLLQIAATLVTGRLARAYALGSSPCDTALWAHRHVLVSAASGAAWGIGALIWFLPHRFPAEAFLALAFLGMTTAEFITRAVYRPSYLAHAAFSLIPLVVLLVTEGNLYATLSGVLVLFFGGVLFSYCEDIASLLDDALTLRLANADLLGRLSREKREAERSRDLAEASTRAKSAFVANISHEIRTPLNALLGMAQLLERSDLDRAQKSHVRVLLEAGRGLKTLLDDVIALSQDEGESPPEEISDPAEAARTVARLLQARAWEKQLHLAVTTPPDLPRAASDPRRLRQVLLKLADNALKFTDRGGIDIGVEPTTLANGEPGLQFVVRDTGPGIPPEIAPRIFEPLLPDSESHTRRQEGAGLGLAVAKRVVTAFGGEIGFESEPGEGSVFWFTVPAVAAPHEEMHAPVAVAGQVAPPSGLALLVWSGEESVRSEIGQMLEPFGNRLDFPASVTEALAMAGRGEFDAIIASAGEADSIAAAPGTKAPLLALLRDGDAAPAAAFQALRWPTGPGALYVALREMLGRAADVSVQPLAATQSPATIDATAFAALEKSLGLGMLVEILQSYIKTAEDLTAHLEKASAAERWDDATRIAQDIAGSAGGLGLLALTGAARGFAQRIREGGSNAELQDAAARIAAEHRRVRKALSNLYPELAAA